VRREVGSELANMKTHFVMMAKYNAWANVRLFRMAAALRDELYRKEVGAYFKSLHGTLNHLLAADRIWMRRLTQVGDAPDCWASASLIHSICSSCCASRASR